MKLEIVTKEYLMKCNSKLHFPTQQNVCSYLWFWSQLDEDSEARMGLAARNMQVPTKQQWTVCGLVCLGFLGEWGEVARVGGLFSPQI